MKTYCFHVEGIHCASCNLLIEKHLRKLKGVQKVKVNRSKNLVEIQSDKKITVENVNNVIRAHGYSASKIGQIPTKKIKPARRWMEAGAALLIISGLFLALKQFNLLPNIGITDNMSYGFIFLIGLVAATSSCLAVSGGLLLTIANKYNETHPNLTGWQRFKPHIWFNVGRIVSYTLLGGLVGLLGGFLTISSTINGIIIVLASVIMIVFGLQMLHIFPWLNKIHLGLPHKFVSRIYHSSENTKTSYWTALAFGAATFFLPCGFTQGLQLYVLGTGSFTVGALTMFFFSLGTLPSLISLGALSSFTRSTIQRYFMTLSAILIIILGVYNIQSGITLTGFSQPETSEQENVAPIINGKQIVTMKIVGLQYIPSQFTLVEGIPVEWTIDAVQAVGCARIITVPSLGITENLPTLATKTISFTPEKTGTIPFSCTMGMTTPGARFTVVKV